MKISIIVIAFTLLLTACGDKNEEVIGLYKYEDDWSNTEAILEIKKDGDTYLLIGDIIKGSEPRALSETSDGLSYRNTPLKLSDDGDTLYFGSVNGTRVSREYLAEKLSTIEQNKILCEKLQNEVNSNNESMNAKQWNQYVETLSSRIPEDCHLIGAVKRWLPSNSLFLQ